MEERVRALCRQNSGARLIAALLELARDVTHSPSGLLGLVTDGRSLRITAVTPDLLANEVAEALDKNISLKSWGGAWAGALLSNATVIINASHALEPGNIAMRRSLAVPIIFASELIGFMYLANKATDYVPEDAEIIEQIAHWSALEIREMVEANGDSEVITVADEPTMPAVDTADWLGDKFRLLFELAPMGMVLSELDGRLLLPNQAFLDIVQYTREETIRLTERDFAVDDSPGPNRNILLALSEHGRFGPVERRYRRKDGTVVPVLLHGLVIKAVDGTPYRWTFVQDIGEAKNIAAALQKSKLEADAAARAKADFVASVSHELRTPINGVVGLSNLLLDTALSPEQQDYVESVRRSGQSLLDLVNDVLDFSRLEGGHILLELVPFSLSDIIDRTIDLISEQAAAKGLRINLSYDEALPKQLLGDPGRVRQVLLNLLSNAVKFTERGYIKVTVSCDRETDEDVIIGFSVEDTGIGLPEDMRTRVFNSFVQVDTSNTRKVGGTGLGLAISKRLVNLMGGTIGVDGTSSGGSRFHFTARFKRVREQRQAPSTGPGSRNKRAPIEPDSRHGRILVAEDNRVNQLVLVRMLERLGYRADAVANGLEAIAAMRQAAYDLVLMDCHMPEMDGFEATRRIRAGAAGAPDVAIVAVTAGANRTLCSDVGMNDYLTKPIDPDTLGAAVERWLPQSNQARA